MDAEIITQQLQSLHNSPFGIVYGSLFSFKKHLEQFRQALKDDSKGLYLEIDAQSVKYNTWPATLVGIFSQVGETVLQHIPSSDESTQLQVYKRLHLLQNLQHRIQEHSAEEQLVQYMNFAELVFYPLLGMLWQAAPCVTLGVLHVEKMLHWGHELRNFFVDSLLRHFQHRLLRIVLYVQSSEKPDVFFGSGEMYASKQVSFYCLEE
jgi:hypothetical protein